jgi:hypothetical protein
MYFYNLIAMTEAEANAVLPVFLRRLIDSLGQVT